MTEILNCPKCKSEAEIIYEDYHEEYHIECTVCSISYGLSDDGESFRGYEDKDQLIREWND